ncbi:hypothetical protein [Campylobacter sp. P0085]|uniref:hypothetical protein n=1 Tax=Campylobacter sp. P0085 TaxID=1895597 RepID=UPI000A333A31|nr:hypothetical protein [Campylobacter sp. P0085]
MQKHIRENGNIIYGDLSKQVNLKLDFKGKNSILFLSPKCTLKNTCITLKDNSLVFLGDGLKMINIIIHSHSVCYMGNNNYCNPSGQRSLLLSERKNIIIGDQCLFSHTIWFRNADPHLIYDNITNKRINPTQSIYIGDHVWVGQEVAFLKKSFVASGSIIGTKSVVTKLCYSNTINAGNPIKQVKENISWRGECVHNWDLEETNKYNYIPNNDFKYTYNQNEFLSPKAIEEKLDSLNTAQEKLEFVYNAIYCNKNKNRFAYFKDMPYDIPLPKYENKFKSLKFEEIDETKPQPTSQAPKPTPQPTSQELEIKALKEQLAQKEQELINMQDKFDKQNTNISILENKYQKALNTKNHLSYKLGNALIKAHKNWYKGGYVKFIFEVMRIKKEHRNRGQI